MRYLLPRYYSDNGSILKGNLNASTWTVYEISETYRIFPIQLPMIIIIVVIRRCGYSC